MITIAPQQKKNQVDIVWISSTAFITGWLECYFWKIESAHCLTFKHYYFFSILEKIFHLKKVYKTYYTSGR